MLTKISRVHGRSDLPTTPAMFQNGRHYAASNNIPLEMLCYTEKNRMPGEISKEFFK